ncbi:MAG: N-acetylmuramoyl-L-alanine amidase [Pseudomonadota bacterium]
MTSPQALLLLAISAAWGLHMAVIKVTVDMISPLTYVAMRMAIIALILAPLLRWYPGKMLRILIAGLCFGGINYAFMFTGVKLTNASIGAVISESYVVIATAFSILFLGERVGWRRSLGIAAAIVGVMIIATGEGDSAGSENLTLGAFFIIMAVTAEATGAIFIKKIDGVKPLSLLAWFAVVGCFVTFALSALFDSNHFAWVGTDDMVPIGLATLYSVFVASIFGHASYYYLLQRVPLSVIAPSGLLITLFAVLAGVFWLGEPLTMRFLAGGALVLSGVAVVLFRSHPPDRKQVIAAAASGAEERQWTDDDPITLYTSPNYGDRKGRDVSMVVLHYTGMTSAEEALQRLCDPKAGVSAHHLIDEKGRHHALVDERERAWHAGVSEWQGEDDINSVSIGIELVNPGHEFGYRAFPEAQIETLIRVLRDILIRHDIDPARVVGHSDVAPDRKQDPGEKFPWARLQAEGLAIGPAADPATAASKVSDTRDAEDGLRQIGYAVDRFGIEACVTAFQRRFLPQALGRGLNEKTKQAITQVVRHMTVTST